MFQERSVEAHVVSEMLIPSSYHFLRLRQILELYFVHVARVKDPKCATREAEKAKMNLKVR